MLFNNYQNETKIHNMLIISNINTKKPQLKIDQKALYEKKLLKFLVFIRLNLTLSIGLVEFETIKNYILKTTASISYYNLPKKYTYNTFCYMCFCC